MSDVDHKYFVDLYLNYNKGKNEGIMTEKEKLEVENLNALIKEADIQRNLSMKEANYLQTQLGRKFDQDKPRMELLPPLATLEVAKVLTFGANKYEPNNWKYVPDAANRYTAGALRHIFARMAQEQLDPESGLDHLAHAICCLMFILEDQLEKSTEERSREANAN